MSLIILSVIVAILFVVGLAGTIIPGLPGIGLIFAGIILYAIVTGFTTVSAMHVLLFAVVSALALAANYAGSMMGARAGGGGASSTVGTILGAIIGTVTLGPLGLFAGAFIGALAGAFYEGRTSAVAMKVAFYSVIGIVGGAVIQLLLGLSMIAAFIWLIV